MVSGQEILARTVGESIAFQMGLRGIPRQMGESDVAWVERYCSWLVGKLQGKQIEYWIVIDSFHQVLLSEGARALIVQLAQRIAANLSQVRLVLLGYQEVGALEGALKNKRQIQREEIKEIGKDALGNFFSELYQQRKERRHIDFTEDDIISSVRRVMRKVPRNDPEWLQLLSDAVAEEASKLV